MLFGFIASLVGTLIDSVTGVPIAGLLIFLVLLLPGTAVFVRRLHDVDRTTGWALFPVPMLIGVFMLLWLLYAVGGERFEGVRFPGVVFLVGLVTWIVMLVVLIVLLVWCCKRGTPGPNRYGPDPFAGAIGAASA
jgi:uncharacterized membrane protein YhaH (DUF805 family)